MLKLDIVLAYGRFYSGSNVQVLMYLLQEGQMLQGQCWQDRIISNITNQVLSTTQVHDFMDVF